MNRDFDAMVIGAGFAGVTAARELGARGKQTLVLEGRDRLGGRTWTDSFAGTNIELGGTWVHWMQPHVWAEITRYDVPIIEDDPPDRCVLASGSGLDSFDAEPAFERLVELGDRYFEGGMESLDRPYDPLFREEAIRELDKVSVRKRFDDLGFSDEDRKWLDGLFSMVAGGPSADAAFTMLARWHALSGWSFALMWDVLSRYRFKDGTVGMLEAMLSDGGVDLRLDTPVAAIADTGEGVEVTTRAGETFAAAAAVVAVPANVWPTIEFSAGLEDERLAVATRGIGVRHGAKCWAHVRGDIGRVMAQPPEGYPITVALTYAELSENEQLLVCFSSNPEFDPTDRGKIEAAIAQILPEAEVLDTRGHAWIDDEFANGAWAFLRPGQLTESLQALQQPLGRLVFATSDIASGWSGYIDGAVESGLRAARQLTVAEASATESAALVSG